MPAGRVGRERIPVRAAITPPDAAGQRLRHDLDALEAAVSRLIQETRQAPADTPARADLAEAVRDRMSFWSVLAKSQGRPSDVQAPARAGSAGMVAGGRRSGSRRQWAAKNPGGAAARHGPRAGHRPAGHAVASSLRAGRREDG